MYRRKRNFLLFIISIAICLFFSQVPIARSADFSDDYLQFAIEGGKIYFFQPRTGRVFVYQTTTSRFSHMLTLESLGADLRRSRSISVIEEETKDSY